MEGGDPRLGVDEGEGTSGLSPMAYMYKTTLIIAPSQTLSVWSAEAQKFFPNLHVKIFAGSRFAGPYHTRRMTLGSRTRNLLEHLLSIPDTPEALLHVTLTSYTTFVLRAKYPRHKGDEVVKRLMREARRRTRNDEEDQEDEDEDTNEADDPDNEEPNAELPQMRKLHDSSITFKEYNYYACNGIYWSEAAEKRFGKGYLATVPDLEPDCTKAQIGRGRSLQSRNIGFESCGQMSLTCRRLWVHTNNLIFRPRARYPSPRDREKNSEFGARVGINGGSSDEQADDINWVNQASLVFHP